MEFFISSKKIGENLKSYYQLDSVQYTIQDGEDAGTIYLIFMANYKSFTYAYYPNE